MGLSEREYYRDSDDDVLSRRSGSGRSIVVHLIVVNVFVLVLDKLLARENWLTHQLAITPKTLVEPWHWWQLLTAAFAHSPDDIWHIVTNMLTLWFFGRPMEKVAGRWEFLRFYLGAAIFGNIVWCARTYLTGASGAALGASGAVVAVVIWFVCTYPRSTIVLLVAPVPAWVAGIVIVLVNVLGIDTRLKEPGQTAGAIAFDIHLAGVAFALAYYFLRWNFGRLMPSALARSLAKMTRSRSLRVHAPEEDIENEADRILDKIHQQGESSLSARERKILETYSRRMRQKHQ